jgi:hypothetical protein
MVIVIDRIKQRYLKGYDKDPVFTLFLTILMLFFIVFVAAAIITSGDTFYGIINPNKQNFFSDHFDSVFYSHELPYTFHKVIYPPLVTVFYAVIGDLTIPFIPNLDVLSPETIRDSQMGLMFFIIIMLLSFYLLHLIYSKLMKDKDVRTVQKELMFLLVILLANPFIYALERGNNIILALVFCFVFVLGYRSENKWIRYASYIALGCAAGFKIYPAILWLLILRERRYKEAGICAVIVIVLLFLPFVFTDGNPLVLLENIVHHAKINLGLTNINQLMMETLHLTLKMPYETASAVGWALTGVFTLLSYIVILFDKKMKFWKILALLSCNLILGPGVGVQYQIIYMLIPVLYFLAAEKKLTRENLFYVVCFAMMFVLIPGIIVSALESAFVLLVAVVLLGEGLVRIYRNTNMRRNTSTAA